MKGKYKNVGSYFLNVRENLYNQSLSRADNLGPRHMVKCIRAASMKHIPHGKCFHKMDDLSIAI